MGLGRKKEKGTIEWKKERGEKVSKDHERNGVEFEEGRIMTKN